MKRKEIESIFYGKATGLERNDDGTTTGTTRNRWIENKRDTDHG
jgi:hypothetical protein